MAAKVGRLGAVLMDFKTKVLRLFDQRNDTAQIAEILSKESNEPVHESTVYRALNAARHERKLRAYMDGE